MRLTLSGADASGLSGIRTTAFFTISQLSDENRTRLTKNMVLDFWHILISITTGFKTMSKIYSHIQRSKSHTSNAWGEKLETFFKEGTTQTGREKKQLKQTTEPSNGVIIKSFKKSRNVSNRTSLKERRGREQTAAAETSEAVICEIPPRLRLSFHSTLESYIHKPKCIFILYLAYHCIDPPEQNGFEKFLKGLLGGLQKSVFFGWSLSCMRPRK